MTKRRLDNHYAESQFLDQEFGFAPKGVTEALYLLIPAREWYGDNSKGWVVKIGYEITYFTGRTAKRDATRFFDEFSK
jgi:hypothetical protein